MRVDTTIAIDVPTGRVTTTSPSVGAAVTPLGIRSDGVGALTWRALNGRQTFFTTGAGREGARRPACQPDLEASAALPLARQHPRPQDVSRIFPERPRRS